MNIFGVGGMELVLILLIMLVVAGPKRMMRWAYILGTYTSRLRRMWEETVDYLQHEFDEAGVDVQVPRDLPTRQNINRSIRNAMKPVTDPVEETLGEVKRVDRETREAMRPTPRPRPAGAPASPAGEEEGGTPGLGTWSGQQRDGNLGTWSASSGEDSEQASS